MSKYEHMTDEQLICKFRQDVYKRQHFKHPYVDEIEAASASGTKKEGETNAAAFWGRKEISLKDIALAVATAFKMCIRDSYLHSVLLCNNIKIEFLL